MYNTPEYLKEKEKFDIYLEQSIKPELLKFEEKRKKYLYRFIASCVIVGLWLSYMAYDIKGYLTSDTSELNGLISVLGIGLILWPLLYYYKTSKESILPLIIGYFGDFKYIFQGKIPDSLLQQSLIIKKYEKFETDDTFEGMYDNVPVMLAEYTRGKYQVLNNEEKKKTVFKKEAHGIIFQAQMNKKFKGQTIVVKDKGFLNKFTKYKNMERVGLESPEFEKIFEVYSDNQIEARFILTTVMLEYLLALKEIFPHIEFSFFNQNVFINIEIKENFFECSNFFRSILNKNNIDKNFKQFYLLFSIIKTLKLNQEKML